MYSITALIKNEEHYDFFIYTGRPVVLNYRGKEQTITKGQKFGVRKSANGKQIRLVLDDALTRVFTIDLETANKLAKNLEPVS